MWIILLIILIILLYYVNNKKDDFTTEIYLEKKFKKFDRDMGGPLPDSNGYFDIYQGVDCNGHVYDYKPQYKNNIFMLKKLVNDNCDLIGFSTCGKLYSHIDNMNFWTENPSSDLYIKVNAPFSVSY